MSHSNINIEEMSSKANWMDDDDKYDAILQKKKIIDDNNDVYKFAKYHDGYNIDEWLQHEINPKYKSMIEEFQNNPHTQNNLHKMLQQCVQLHVSPENKEQLSIHEIMAIKCFTDVNELQKELNKIYHSTDIASLRNRRKYYWWGTKLKQTLHYLGLTIPIPIPKKISKVWRGINKLFQIQSFNPETHQPTSFTYDQFQADRFAQGCIILHATKVKGSTIEWISDFTGEYEFFSYGGCYTVNKIELLSVESEENMNYLLEHLKHLSKPIPHKNIFTFRGEHCNLQHYIISALKQKKDMTFQINHNVLTNVLQRIFFELRQYWIASSIWDGTRTTIKDCSKEEVMYILDNYILNTSNKQLDFSKYKVEIKKYFEENGIDGRKLRVFFISPNTLSNELTPVIQKTMIGVELTKTLSQSIDVYKQQYDQTQMKYFIDKTNVLNYVESVIQNQPTIDAHRISTMGIKKFLLTFQLTKYCSLTLPGAKKLYNIIKQTIHCSDYTFNDLNSRIAKCVNDLSVVPISNKIWLHHQWNDIGIDIFDKLTGGMELISTKEGFYELNCKNNPQLLTVYPPSQCTIDFIYDESANEDKHFDQYQIILTYFNKREYTLISRQQAIKLQDSTKTPAVRPVVSTKLTIVESRRTAMFGNDEVGGEWIYRRMCDGRISGMRLWYDDRLCGICLQLNGRWQKVYGRKSRKLIENILKIDEFITNITIYYDAQINALHFETNKHQSIGAGLDQGNKSVTSGINLSGIKIKIGSIKGIQFQWKRSKQKKREILEIKSDIQNEQSQNMYLKNDTMIEWIRKYTNQQYNNDSYIDSEILNKMDEQLVLYCDVHKHILNEKKLFSQWIKEHCLSIDDIEQELSTTPNKCILTLVLDDVDFPILSSNECLATDEKFYVLKYCWNIARYEAQPITLSIDVFRNELVFDAFNSAIQQIQE
eukprot:134146_1